MITLVYKLKVCDIPYMQALKTRYKNIKTHIYTILSDKI